MSSLVQEIVVLLPCHSLDDFPTYHEGDEAASLLSTYTAAWHPALLNAARRLPTWHRADMLPPELAGRLLLVPPAAVTWLPSDFAERTAEANAIVVRGHADREGLVNEVLDAAGISAAEADRATPADTLADFFALGYYRLMVELLTRIMRYTSTIDESRLQVEALAAIDAALKGDLAEVDACLTRAFDLLCESRRYFFPVDPHFIDLTLVAETTLGASLRHELAHPHAKNLLICGRDLETLANAEPATLAQLADALKAHTACVVGGDYDEPVFPLMPLEACRDEILRGLSIYETVLARRPLVYARRRAGLAPWLPQLLCRTGFQAALHFTLDEGQFPTAYNGKVRWETSDGSVVEALAQVPHDAQRPDPFIQLPRSMGEILDRDNAPVLVFAHWPGQICRWYEDLRRGARFAPALGKFDTLENYFQTTAGDAPSSEFRADEYRTPYLRQAVHGGQHDTISTWAAQHASRAAETTAATLQLLQSALHLDSPPGEPAAKPALALNPHNFSYAVAAADRMVPVPGLGFAKLDAASSEKRGKPKSGGVQVEDHTLRNEFCELVINDATGGIQSLRDLRTRGNRLSQQLAMRLPVDAVVAGTPWRDPDTVAEYSRMMAEEITITDADPVAAAITSRGKLLAADDQHLANFTQHTRLAAGSQLVELRWELEILREPIGDPWLCYYAVRWAFPDTESAWYQAMGFRREPVLGRRFESPTLVEVESQRWRTAILSPGLPFHRRTAKRMLDTLLVVPGETARQFNLTVGIDLNQPFAAQAAQLAPPVTVELPADNNLPDQGWLFHVDAKNILATAWEALPPNGFRARLHETAGAAGKVCVRCYRPVATARLCDFLGGTLCELSVEHDKLWLETRPYEWTQLEVQFA